jgi:hypothetical protein
LKSPKQKLADILDGEGWDINRVHVADLDWWADEIWELRSRRSPEGVSAFITFIVDPQHEGLRSKGQAVWGVGVCATMPVSRREAESLGTVALNMIGKREVEAFIERVGALRVLPS